MTAEIQSGEVHGRGGRRRERYVRHRRRTPRTRTARTAHAGRTSRATRTAAGRRRTVAGHCLPPQAPRPRRSRHSDATPTARSGPPARRPAPSRGPQREHRREDHAETRRRARRPTASGSGMVRGAFDERSRRASVGRSTRRDLEQAGRGIDPGHRAPAPPPATSRCRRHIRDRRRARPARRGRVDDDLCRRQQFRRCARSCRHPNPSAETMGVFRRWAVDYECGPQRTRPTQMGGSAMAKKDATVDDRTVTKDETEASRSRQRLGQAAGRVRPRPVAAPEQLGPLGDVFEDAGYTTLAPAGPTIPTPSRRPRSTPRSSPTSPSARSRTTSRT